MARMQIPAVLDANAYVFTHHIRARFAETDAMGIVHHSSYLLYLEEARVEWLRAAGRDYASFRVEGYDFAVLEVFTQYVSPVRFDDEMTVRLRLSSTTRSTFQVDYVIEVGGETRLIAATLHACLTRDGRPARLPAWVEELA